MPRPDPLDLEPTECPYYLISRASLGVTAALRRELADAGVGQVRPAYLGVLLVLWREDGSKIGELGRRAGLEPSTMTGLLDRMERDGLLVRAADPHDRRAQRVSLTKAGAAVQEPVRRVVSAVLERAFEGLSGRRIDALKDTLRQILDNAERS